MTYVGEGDLARLVKLAHNIFLGVVIQSLAEITVLAESGGVARAAFLEFMNDSVLGSAFTRYKSPALVNLDYTPTFTPVLLRKDFDYGLAAARALDVPMPVAALTAQLVQASVSSGPGRRGLRDPARPAGGERRARAEAGGRRGRRRLGQRAAAVTVLPAAGRCRPPGHMGVDYEQRVDFDRLRDYRLGRAKASLEAQRAAVPSCCSTSTTSATPRRRGSAARSATR